MNVLSQRSQTFQPLGQMTALAILLGQILLASVAVTLPAAAQVSASPDPLSLDPPSPGSLSRDPWGSLLAARESLHRGPQTADFAQTFVPAGFSSGERETGRILLDLPGCLRWDYEIPDRKSFLFCEDEVWFWNQDEPAGRHYKVDPEEEPGLDLLLLDVERLRERYEARAEDAGDGRRRIVLVPLRSEFGVTPAGLTIETGTGRLVEIGYSDAEGNATRFRISGYRPAEEAGRLTPPADIEWTDE